MWAIRRLRLADRETMAIELLYVPQAHRARAARGATSKGSRSTTCWPSATASSSRPGTQTIEPTVTNEEEAEVLGVPLHAPAFLFERTSTSERGEVVEFVRSIYRGDRYRLVTELRPRWASR